MNHSPTINAQSFAVAENSDTGTTVGPVAASDVDTGNTLTFTIIAGNSSGAFCDQL
jgi:hypothetical protein